MNVMPPNNPDLGRRGFLALATRALLWLAGGAAALGLSRYLSYESPPTRPTRFTLDVVGAYPTGTRAVVAEAGAVVFRDAKGLYARSLVCGHLGCRVQSSNADGYDCPCHGSRFAGNGKRLQGPAPRDLDSLSLALDDQGRLVLDVSARVDATWRLPVEDKG